MGCEHGGAVKLRPVTSAKMVPSRAFLGYMNLQSASGFDRGQSTGLTIGGRNRSTIRDGTWCLFAPINGATGCFPGTPYFTEKPGDIYKGPGDVSGTFDWMAQPVHYFPLGIQPSGRPTCPIFFRLRRRDNTAAGNTFGAGPGRAWSALDGQPCPQHRLRPSWNFGNRIFRKSENRLNMAILVQILITGASSSRRKMRTAVRAFSLCRVQGLSFF